MVVVEHDGDGGINVQINDAMMVDFEVTIDAHVPKLDEDAIKEELARRLGWESENITLHYWEHESDRIPSGTRDYSPHNYTVVGGAYAVPMDDD